VGKSDLIHERVSADVAEPPVPLQARLKSSGLRIGELAAVVGVRASAIRYYEELGLMPRPGRRSGWRVYGTSDVNRLKLITMARRLGFSINDLKGLAGHNTEALRVTAVEQATLIREKIITLASSAKMLDKLAACSCTLEADCLLSDAQDA
jgi:DNA-binding transcriptional MerR regulator